MIFFIAATRGASAASAIDVARFGGILRERVELRLAARR